MTVEDIKQHIMSLTPPEYQEIWDFIVSEEHDRRRSEKYAAQVVEELQESGQLKKTESVTEDEAKAGADAVPEWKNPGTDHTKMYHFGDVVRYQGQLVRSTHQGLNSWEPGTLGFDGRIWEILEPEETPDEPETSETEETPDTEEPSTPAWAPNLIVNPGQKYTHNSNTYEVIQAHTTQQGWEPPAAPALWKKL